MKKNLRNILALSLGLMTTVAFAQDWNVDSRTRIDMSGADNDQFIGTQRATVGTTWGGSDWAIHASTEVNYTLNVETAAALSVYEAYASTDLMGYASLTVGRQALEYGSGTIIGKNDWGTRNTRDGMTFGLNFDMADVTLGYAKIMANEEVAGVTSMYFNAAKAEGDWNANLLYGSDVETANGEDGSGTDYMGLDLGYNMMDGALALNVSYNTLSNDDQGIDADMTVIGATYSVNESLSIMGSQTIMGDQDIAYERGNMGSGVDSWMTHGNIGFQGANDEMITIGGNYEMGAFNLGFAMYTVTNDEYVNMDGSDFERNATEISLGYTMSDNASLSLKSVNDDLGLNGDDYNFTYVTLHIGL